jgi:hypothetical protein
MRACFLGQNVTALGFGVAMLQTPPMAAEPPLENQWRSHPQAEPQPKADAPSAASKSAASRERPPESPEPAPDEAPRAA